MNRMTAIHIVCFAIFRIVSASVENSNNGVNCHSIVKSRYGELKCKNISSVYLKPFWFDEQQKCTYQSSSTSQNGHLPVECHGYIKCNTNQNQSKQAKRYQNDNRSININNYFPLYSGDIASFICQPSRDVNIENIPYNNTICEASMLSKNDQLSDKQICERSFTCSIENTNKTGSIDVNCTVGNIIPSDDKTTQSHVQITVDDKRTKSYGGYSLQDDVAISSPFLDRSTEYYGSYGFPDDDASEKTRGFTNSAFIVSGILGVVLVICIIVGVFLLRKCRSAQGKSEERVIQTINPMYDLTVRQRSDENNHQDNVMDDRGALHCSTSHTIYFDNRTDDISYAKVNKSCHKQQSKIEAIKEESNSYPHPRNTADYADDLYDHTMHNVVHDIISGDYGITQRRITEDDYDVSGNYQTSLFIDQDSVYN